MALKINYLVKDELIYELTLRGVNISSENGVDYLRKALRENFNKPTSVSNLTGKLTVPNEIDTVQNKIDRVQIMLDDNIEKSTVLQISKLEAKLKHLETRVSNLSKVELGDTYVSKVQEFISTLNNFNTVFSQIKNRVSAEEINSVDTQLNNSIIEEERLNDSLNKLVMDRVNPSSPNEEKPEEVLHTSSPVQQPAGISGLQDPGIANRPTTGKNLSAPLLVQKPIGASALHAPVSIDSTQQYNPQANSLFFNKLTNPLEKYLNEIPACDGLDINILLRFLRAIVRIQNETSLSQLELYELLPSYCQGPLLSKVIQSKRNQNTLDQMHCEIIGTFIAVNLKEKLKQELIFRPQGKHEPLSVYINEIKLHNQILKTHMTEMEIVSLIRNGLNPEVRNKLVFEKSPTCYADLDQLCINCNNVSYNDYVRESTRPSGNVMPRTTGRFVSAPVNRHRIESNDHRDSRKCFNCGRNGHLAKNCYRSPKNL